MQKVGIINLEVSNIASVSNMLNKLGAKGVIVNEPHEVFESKIKKIILPGVGSFDSAINKLNQKDWKKTLDQYLSDKTNAILGICLGMQILFKKSEEGKLPGLGWIDGKLNKFNFLEKELKVPHMGWNVIKPNTSKKIFNYMSSEQRFYFVHSYYAECNDKNDIAAVCNYGFDFTCAIERENIFGVQFHPEKSHRFGIEFLKNFLAI